MTRKREIPRGAGPDELARFWAKVDKSGGPDACWMWRGSRATEGRYGTFYASDGKRYRAHRWLYVQLIGIQDHQNDIDHTCHNKDESCTDWDQCEHHGCVNPAHLEEVTHAENTLRGNSFFAECARKTHCPQGHPYDDENTYYKQGTRGCRECHRTRVREANRLAKGIPLDAPMRPTKTHCKWGHERTPENLYSGGVCKQCTKRRNEERRAKEQVSVRPQKTHCKWGHEYTDENTYWQDGRRSCVTCRRERARLQNESRSTTLRKAAA